MRIFWNLIGIFVFVLCTFSIKDDLEYYIDSSVPRYVTVAAKEQRLTADQVGILTHNLEYLKDEFSPHVISHLRQATKVARSWSRSRRAFEVSGFESIGIVNSALSELWSEKHYPRQWIEGNVRNVNYSKSSRQVNAYGKEHYRSGEVNPLDRQIVLFGSPGGGRDVEEANRENIDWVFSHELGHCNDWIGATYLLPVERVELLVEVTEAYKNPDSFRGLGGYVESIKDKDEKMQRYFQTREWWATICEWYFTFPDLLKRNSEKDFLLVDRWVKKRDPQYDPKKAQKARDVLFKKILKGGVQPASAKKLKRLLYYICTVYP